MIRTSDFLNNEALNSFLILKNVHIFTISLIDFNALKALSFWFFSSDQNGISCLFGNLMP